MADNTNFDDALQRAKQLAAKFSSEYPSNSSTGLKRHADDTDDVKLNQKRVNVNEKLAAASEAAALLNSKIGSSNSSGLYGQQGHGNLTVEHKVPDNMVGLIIGKKGEQITRIQKDTGCTVQITPDSNGMPDRLVTLTGTTEQIESVKRIFDDIIGRGKSGQLDYVSSPYSMSSAASGGIQTIEISVPGPKAGLLIGKNGETIKALQEQTGVKMVLVQDSNAPSENDKPLRITGDAAKVEIAKQKVIEIINSRITPGFLTTAKPSTTFAVPNEKAGLVIGKGGETIKEIIRQSGAYVEIQKTPPPNPTIKIFNIVGEERQIDQAIRLICERANIPLPSSYTGMASTAGYYGAEQAYGGWMQPASADIYGQSNGSAAGSMPPPTINPHTGQLDYTAAWVEYYRRQGMHQQAESILRQTQQTNAEAAAAASTGQSTNGGAAVATASPMDYSQQWMQWHQYQQQQQYAVAATAGSGTAVPGVTAESSSPAQWTAGAGASTGTSQSSGAAVAR